MDRFGVTCVSGALLICAGSFLCASNAHANDLLRGALVGQVEPTSGTTADAPSEPADTAPDAAEAAPQATPDTGASEAPPSADEPLLHRICHWIAREAERNDLPPTYFGRLLWVESRYDPQARSHKNAQGIAQFIPSTARLRGLEDPYDPESAIAASAAYLAEMRDRYGNLGQAAIGYNGGEGRLRRWRAGRRGLPRETRRYVAMITGLEAEAWRDRSLPDGTKPAWDEKTDSAFLTRCRARKIRRLDGSSGAVAAVQPSKPWGLKVAGHARRATALAIWRRLQAKHRNILGEREPMVLRSRNKARGGVRQHTVVVGADTRSEAQRICDRLKRAGGFCLVVKN